jgi:phosphoadenosine phosphosulfate reductase
VVDASGASILVDLGRGRAAGTHDGSGDKGDDILATSADIDIAPQEIEARAYEFETAPAGKVIAWAVERFGSGVSLACSFQDCVIVDLATQIDPGIEVLFLDTGFHFPETLDYVEDVRRRYDLNLRVLTPGPEADAFPCGSDRCCEMRKVVPLDRALEGRQAWMTGLKRVDALTRAATPILSWDETRRLLKVNPIATWTEEDVNQYEADHNLPIHPLVPRGYLSIGCAPTTRPVAPGEDPRAGRWAGSNKTECGLHV